MPELYDFKDGQWSWFQKYLLESGSDAIRKLASSEDFDSSKMQVKLTINGMDIRIDEFSSLLDKWSDDIAEQLKQQLDFNKSEQAVNEKAAELIKDRLGNINEVLIEIENSLWKLD